MLAHKPNHLVFSDYMMHCAVSLGEELEVQTDNMLVPLIKLQRLAEEVNSMRAVKASESQEDIVQIRSQMHAKTFQAQLDSLMPAMLPQSRTSSLRLTSLPKSNLTSLLDSGSAK